MMDGVTSEAGQPQMGMSPTEGDCVFTGGRRRVGCFLVMGSGGLSAGEIQL